MAEHFSAVGIALLTCAVGFPAESANPLKSRWSTDTDHDERRSIVASFNYQPFYWFVNLNGGYTSYLGHGATLNFSPYLENLLDRIHFAKRCIYDRCILGNTEAIVRVCLSVMLAFAFLILSVEYVGAKRNRLFHILCTTQFELDPDVRFVYYRVLDALQMASSFAFAS